MVIKMAMNGYPSYVYTSQQPLNGAVQDPYCGVMKQADMPSCLEGGEFRINRDQGMWAYSQKARVFL